MRKTEIKLNAVIAGATKCATSSVHSWLADHPEVCAASVKDSHYFVDRDYPYFNKKSNYYDHGLAGIDRYFHRCKNKPGVKIYLESTASYFDDQKTPLMAISQIKPHPKIILIIRKPSERVISAYKFFVNNALHVETNLTFSEVLDMIRRSTVVSSDERLLIDMDNTLRTCRYIDFIPKWVNAFGNDCVRVFLFETLKKDPVGFMRDVSKYLGIDQKYWDGYDFKRHNESVGVKSRLLHRLARSAGAFIPKRIKRESLLREMYFKLNISKLPPPTEIDLKILNELDEEFRPYNDALAEYLHIDLSAWR